MLSLFGDTSLEKYERMMKNIFNEDYIMRDFITRDLMSDRGEFWDLSVNNFVEKDGQYIYEMEYPKTELSDLKVTEFDNRVEIETKHEDKSDKSYSSQRTFRSLSLPKGAKKGTVKAKHHHGKLMISIDKE